MIIYLWREVSIVRGAPRVSVRRYISIFNIHNDPSRVTRIVHPRVHCARAWVSKEEAHGAASTLSLFFSSLFLLLDRERNLLFGPAGRGSNFVMLTHRPRPVHTKCPFFETSDRKDTPVGFNGPSVVRELRSRALLL